VRRWAKGVIPTVAAIVPFPFIPQGSALYFSTSRLLASTETFDKPLLSTQFPFLDSSVTIDVDTYFNPAPNPGCRLEEGVTSLSPRNSHRSLSRMTSSTSQTTGLTHSGGTRYEACN
jgi:hypothetical protein